MKNLAKEQEELVEVKAKITGFFGGKRRYRGESFKCPKSKIGKWMLVKGSEAELEDADLESDDDADQSDQSDNSDPIGNPPVTLEESGDDSDDDSDPIGDQNSTQE